MTNRSVAAVPLAVMPPLSKRRFEQVAFVSAVFLLLYCLSCVSVWIQWKEMENTNFRLAASSMDPPQPLATLSPHIDSLYDSWPDSTNEIDRIDPLEELEELEVFDESLDGSEYPQRAWKRHEFQCLGWVETDDEGYEIGERRECWQRIRAGDAGYCEVLNATSGEVFHVMHTTSLSLKDDVRFTCQLAKAFSSFRYHAAAYRHDPTMTINYHSNGCSSEGIVMAVYEGVLPSAFASIRRLRDAGYSLPVELWFRHDELTLDNPVLVTLEESFGPVYLRQIFDERINGFYVKVHALYYSQFTKVLLLDADNFVVRDPTPLFSSKPMQQLGAAFWLDFWHPGNSIFNLHAQSLVWELLGLDYVDMLEQESGQVLVNRAVSRPMLDQLLYYATHKPNLIAKLQLVWGDKDLFRLAWLQMKQQFHFNDHRMPGTLGILNQKRLRYCGMMMVQYDLNGRDMLFWHRNTIKLTGRPGFDTHIWQTLQELPPVAGEGGRVRDKATDALPKIQSFNGEKLFNETSCFGVKRYSMDERVEMTLVDQLGGSLASLESTLIEYARQAYQLLHE
ncbi:hypothetical protein BBJ28_00003517 [Nothophytophthora sp. Chile5]|nr:hypothetical protein BBJ28_00003517 [Nothophytophthora sp. Chile5]